MKLIDADLLLKKKTILWDEALGFCDCVLVEDIDEAPGVELVRCKDCKWWTDYYCRNTNGASCMVVNGDWFCAAGERRTDG